MIKKSSSTKIISVENLQKQVNSAVSLFSTILDTLRKSQDEMTAQIDARDAEIAKLSDDLSEEETDIEVERAIDEILKYDFMNIYKKVWQKDPNNTENTQIEQP